MARPRSTQCPAGHRLHDAKHRQKVSEEEMAQLAHIEIMEILKVGHLSPQEARVALELALDDVWDQIGETMISWSLSNRG